MALTSGLLISKFPTFDVACLVWYVPRTDESRCNELGKFSNDFMFAFDSWPLSIVLNLIETLRKLLLLAAVSLGLVLIKMEVGVRGSFGWILLRSLAANGKVLPAALRGEAAWLSRIC